MGANGGEEEPDVEEAGEVFETDPERSEDVPAFCQSLVALVAEGGATDEQSEVEGVEVVNFAGVRLAVLASYEPDEAADAGPDGQRPTTELASKAWAWVQATRKELRNAWGEPQPRELQVLDDGETPASTADVIMKILNRPTADSWERGGLTPTLVTGWKGEPWSSALQQMFFVVGADEEAEALTGGRELFLFNDSNGREFVYTDFDKRPEYLAFEEFRAGPAAEGYTILSAAGEGLDLVPASRLVGRREGGEDGRSEFVRQDDVEDLWTAAFLFFEAGFQQLDYFGPWVDEMADALGSPGHVAATRAASLTTDDQRYAELGRIWSSWGYVSTTEEFCIVLSTRSLEEHQADRALIALLLPPLGLQSVPTPQGEPAGDVWVRMTPRLDQEIGNWV